MKKSGKVLINTESQYEQGKENLESQVHQAVFFSSNTPNKQMSPENDFVGHGSLLARQPVDLIKSFRK